MPARHRRKRLRSLPPPVPQSPFPFEPATWQALVSKLGLPPQQARVAELVLLDKANKEIAAAMGVAEPTVCSHLTRMFAAVGVDSRLGFALRLMALVREGWHLQHIIGFDDVGRDDSTDHVIQPHTYVSGKSG